jgi:hypothetical protein
MALDTIGVYDWAGLYNKPYSIPVVEVALINFEISGFREIRGVPDWKKSQNH